MSGKGPAAGGGTGARSRSPRASHGNQAGPQGPSVQLIPGAPLQQPLPQAATTAPPGGSFTVDGFRTPRLNGTYKPHPEVTISGKPTFWDNTNTLFMYYQQAEKRWAISPDLDEEEDLLLEALHGGTRGLAFQEPSGTWREFFQDVWLVTRPRILALQVPPSAEQPQAPTAPQDAAPLMPLQPAAAIMLGPATGASSMPATRSQLTHPVPSQPTVASTVVSSDGPGTEPIEPAVMMLRKDTRPGKSKLKVLAPREGHRPAGNRKDKASNHSDVRELLKSCSQVEEVLILKGLRGTQLAVRFKDASDAGAAFEVGRRLWGAGCRPHAIEPVGAAKFTRFREECKSSRTKTTADVEDSTKATTSYWQKRKIHMEARSQARSASVAPGSVPSVPDTAARRRR